MNILENKDILSDELLNAIDKINLYAPNAVFGGSIALCACGLLNRKISDIDIFFSDNKTIKEHGIIEFIDDIKRNKSAEFESHAVYYDDITDVNGNNIRRIPLKIDNVRVCCFIVDKNEIEGPIVNFNRNGKEYNLKLQNVSNAIYAKRCYAKKTKKHEQDLVYIESIVNEHFSPNNNENK